MADNNNTQNGSNYLHIEIRTNGVNFFGADGNMLMTQYLDDSICISFCYPTLDETGKRSFPKGNRKATTVKKDAVIAFAAILNSEKFMEAVDSKGRFNKGVFLNRDRTEILSIVVEGDAIALNWYTEIGEDCLPKAVFSFRFQSSQIINGYSASVGGGEIEEIQAQAYIFAHMIDYFSKLSVTNVLSHGAKLGTTWNINRELEYLKAIADKLGAQVQGSSTSFRPNPNYNNGGARSGFDMPSPAPVTSDNTGMAQMQEINSLEGFIQ